MAIEELVVGPDDGTSFRLLFKDLSRRTPSRGVRRLRSTFLYHRARKIPREF